MFLLCEEEKNTEANNTKFDRAALPKIQSFVSQTRIDPLFLPFPNPFPWLDSRDQSSEDARFQMRGKKTRTYKIGKDAALQEEQKQVNIRNNAPLKARGIADKKRHENPIQNYPRKHRESHQRGRKKVPDPQMPSTSLSLPEKQFNGLMRGKNSKRKKKKKKSSEKVGQPREK